MVEGSGDANGQIPCPLYQELGTLYYTERTDYLIFPTPFSENWVSMTTE